MESKRIHILGICGTFMAGIALLAKQQGHTVEGSDQAVYPPMSTQLEAAGIQLHEGYEPKHIDPKTDVVIIGNALSRGNKAVEYVLNQNLSYISGPQWLSENILADRWVLAVAGTHGKTTTSSMLAWILEHAGLNPGFLIGGVPLNFQQSARLGSDPFFVIEADEYDSAFFDKRSKFIHYHPRTLILNNLEFDHADIFRDLAAIQQQFHFLIRTVPGEGLCIVNADDSHLANTLEMGCWSHFTSFSIKHLESDWTAIASTACASEFTVQHQQESIATLQWSLIGEHNMSNALAAIAAANHIGIKPKQAITALTEFKNVKRRMELVFAQDDIKIYDDFAHHPSAIKTTLAGLKQQFPERRIIAILEMDSYTMRTGHHKSELPNALAGADLVGLVRPRQENWGIGEMLEAFSNQVILCDSVDDLVQDLASQITAGDTLLVMCKTRFDGMHAKLQAMLGKNK